MEGLIILSKHSDIQYQVSSIYHHYISCSQKVKVHSYMNIGSYPIQHTSVFETVEFIFLDILTKPKTCITHASANLILMSTCPGLQALIITVPSKFLKVVNNGHELEHWTCIKFVMISVQLYFIQYNSIDKQRYETLINMDNYA